MKQYDYIDYNFVGEKKYFSSPHEDEFFLANGTSNVTVDDDFFSVDGDEEFAYFKAESEDDFYDAEGKIKQTKEQRQAKREAKKDARQSARTDKKVAKGLAATEPKEKGKVGTAIRGFKERFKTFVGKLIPNKKARKLKKHPTKENSYVDTLPVLQKKTGTGGEVIYLKKNPDNTTTALAAKSVTIAQNGKAYDTKDLKISRNAVLEVMGKDMAMVYPAEEVAELQTTDGDTLVFKKDDLLEKEGGADDGKTADAPTTGMSKTNKIVLIAGGVVLAGIIAWYFITRNTKK